MSARRLVCAILLGIGLGFGDAAHASGDIVLVAGRDGVISDIGRDEAEQLYLGRLNALRDGTQVRLHDLPPGPIRDRFYRLMIGKNAVQTRAYWSRLVFTGRARPPREVSGPEDLRAVLAADPNAIGYLPETDVTEEVRVLLSVD
ncbi:hypothetical protein ACKVEX_01710 [Rhodocyclaceae bacterium SMB388]